MGINLVPAGCMTGRDWITLISVLPFCQTMQGKGYAYEAAEKIKHAAIHVFGLKTLCAITTRDNLSSQKLITKLGLQFIKTTRIPNDPEELLLYELSV